MVRDMCQAAGITGFKTNHSLRATTATRLFHAGVDEQLIMERTGRRSLDGVRSYKRTCSEQQQQISAIVTQVSKRQKVDNTANVVQERCEAVTLQNCNNITFNITYSAK